MTLDTVQSCQHDNWKSIAKYLVENVPVLLKLEDLKDVQKVLSIIFNSPPSDLREFVKWIAEVRRQEDGSVALSEEEKERVAIKVFFSFFVFLSCFYFSFHFSPFFCHLFALQNVNYIAFQFLRLFYPKYKQQILRLRF